jgi:hypothetical protein
LRDISDAVLIAHRLLRRISPLLLMVDRRRDAREVA